MGTAAAAQAPDVVRLGNLKFAHYGAVSYMKEACGKYNLKVEERMFPKGPDIMPAIVAKKPRRGQGFCLAGGGASGVWNPAGRDIAGQGFERGNHAA